MKRSLGIIGLLLWSILCMVSCREASAYGTMSIVFPDASSRSILPENTRIAYISVEGSMVGHPDMRLEKQYFKLGNKIDIQGLAAGTWSMSVTGYNGDPEVDGKVVTTTAVDASVSIRSGKTTQAYFVLHYLQEGSGSAKISLTWPNSTVTSVLLSARDFQGDVMGSASASLTPTDFVVQLQIPKLGVGSYDLDVVLTNASGTIITFPMIDMLSIFNDLESTGSIALEAIDVVRVAMPGFSITENGPGVSSRTLTLTCATPNATLVYTTDGSDPSITAGNLGTHTSWYTQPIVLTSPVTIVKAMAVKDGYQDSPIFVSEELLVSGSDDEGGVDISDPIQIRNVVVSSLNEVYLENPQFQITYEMQNSPVVDSVVWYLNGAEVSREFGDTFTYEGYLPSGRHQLSVKLFYHDGPALRSAMGTLRFNNNGQVAKPIVMANEQEDDMQVSLLSEIPLAQIFYTADGSEPTRMSTRYTQPFVATVGSTIKAMAVAEEYRDSEVVCTLLDNDGALTVKMPASIENVIVHCNKLSASNPEFSVTYDRVNVPDETIAWYMDANLEQSLDQDGDGNPTTFTYGGKLSAGRHQVRVVITYSDGIVKQFANGNLRFDIGQATAPAITVSRQDGGKLVSLACATPGTSIYCTTNGYDPNTTKAEELYTEPFIVPLGTTIKAIAAAEDLADSTVAMSVIGYEVGDTGPAGGLIFLVDTADAYAGWTYMEASPTDEGTCGWGGYETFLDATDTSVGSGAMNTGAIADAVADEVCAAKVCLAKSVSCNGESYSDWFLPSRDELNALYSCWKETGKGNFADSGYWSSSEDTAYVSWMQNFADGVMNYGNSNGSKIVMNAVRAIRSF